MRYVGQIAAATFWFLVFWYGGWALLWSYQQTSTPPYPGWWDWALPAAAAFSVVERFSIELEARETAAAAGGFWGAYRRQAAIGMIFGLGLLALGIKAELMPSSSRPFENEILEIGAAFGGALTLVIATAGRRRDYPLLSAIHDLAAGAIIAGTAAWSAFIARPNVEGNGLAWIGACAAVGAALNLWRKSAPGGSLALFLADIAARSRTAVVGAWWAVIGGLILWFTWSNPFERLRSDVVHSAALFFGSAIGIYLLFARGLGPVAAALSLSQRPTDTGGQGCTATTSDLRDAGLMPRRADAIYLGRLIDNNRERESIGYPGEAHLITIGPAGSGKVTGLIIPNLATLRRSILVIDPNGEAAAITARRRAQLGPVIVINPFDVLVSELPHLKSCGFNPLAALDPEHDDFTDDCARIGQALVADQRRGDGTVIGGLAQDLITALVMHEKIEHREHASLANLRAMLTEPFTSTGESGPIGLLKTVIKMTTSKNAALRSKTGRFLRDRNADKDFIAMAVNETQCLDSPQMQRDLRGSGIDWNNLKHEITTVYVILPADRLDTHASYLRLVVGFALRTLLRAPPSKTLPPVLFMLNDFARLGYLPAIENAMGIAGGLGVQLWPFLQDLTQFKALYQDRWQTFLGHAAVLTAFAPRDPVTAQYLSMRAGNKIIMETENEPADAAAATRGPGPPGAQPSRPERLLTMPDRRMLCMAEPVKSPFVSQASSYRDTPFSQGLDSSPYRQG